MRRLLVVSVLSVTVVGAGSGKAFADTAATKPAATLPGTSNDLLTAQEIRKVVDAGEYRDGLKALTRVLTLKGAAAGDYDMNEMLMLKAECLLQTRQTAAAVETLKVAVAAATKDGNELNTDQALALMQLVQASPNLMYTPKTAAIKKPLPILDRTLRKDAYMALFNDLLVVFTTQSKAALSSMNLSLTLNAAQAATNIRAVERVATGSNKQSEEVMTTLATHAVKLINAVLDVMAQRTHQIGDTANQIITHQVTQTMNGHSYDTQQSFRRGLTNSDQQTLRDVIKTCAGLPPVCETLAKALGQRQDELHVAGLKADNVKKDAQTILDDNYTNPVNQSNPQQPGSPSTPLQPNH